MKKYFFLVLTGLLFFSCKKSADCHTSSSSLSLEGTWKMILVNDNATTASFTKPATIANDVMITFAPSGTSAGYFTGRMPTNIIEQGSYSLGASQSISIPSMTMTKVVETSWGAEFANNIRDARQYSFQSGGNLKITTTNKTITFQRQ